MADNRHLEAGFFAVVLLIAIAAVFYILKPFFGVLVIAATLAVIFRPIYLFILKILKNKELIAAFLTVIIVLLAVLMPLAFLGYKIFNEATNLYVISFLPLSAHHSEEIYSRMESAVNSVIRGAIVIAIIQGITAGIGFMIFGVPNAVFWGALTCFAALVPTIGTALVVFPAAAYLLLHGAMWSGLGLIIWGLLVAGLIDNFLSPQLTKKGVGAHPFLVLLSVLGGITVMGPIGFLAGPLILSFLVALLGIYPELVKKEA
ncbi:MAG: AI-2E family transporter [Candidatus Wolfebacteria bacterium]|nr:AI-2E family transporter [Candidatus Wolfebacteria bacterium]